MTSLTPRIDRIERNRLLNSGMHFRQRIGSGTVSMSAGNAYYFDRWGMRFNGDGAFTGTPTVQQLQESPNSKTKYCIGFVGTPSVSNCQVQLFQRLEASESSRLAGEKVSVSIYVRTDSFTSAQLRFLPAGAEDNFTTYGSGVSSTISVSANGSWQQLTWEGIDLSSITVTNGLEVRIEFSTATGTGSSRYLRIAQAMMVVGDRAVDWQMQSATIGEELARCQRYYEKSYNLGLPPGTVDTSGQRFFRTSLAISNSEFTSVTFAVTKRATPTTSIYSPSTGASGKVRNVSAAADRTTLADVGVSETGMNLRYSDTATGASDAFYYHWSADSEL